jgi:hypothetical protein
MNEFLSPDRGSVLWREGKPRNYSYRFSDPMIQPYIVMTALADGLITENDLRLLQDHTRDATADSDGDPNERGQLF